MFERVESLCIRTQNSPEFVFSKQSSITLQAFHNADRKFMDVFTGVSSKIHDARVYKLSPISKNLKGICEDRFHILGDSAYCLREWLLVPFKKFGNMSKEKPHITQNLYELELKTHFSKADFSSYNL